MLEFFYRRRLIAVPFIIGLNILVFLAWQGLMPEEFMQEHFLVSWTSLAQGRYWTAVTTVFSHNLLFHIFINMFVLLSFGSFLERELQPLRFTLFYLVAGIIASLVHCMTSALILGDPDLPALGASGAVAGVVGLFAILEPKARILLLGLIPVPALIGVFIFIGLDAWGLIAQAQGSGLPIGHGAHLGGAFTGLVYGFFLRRISGRQPRLRRA